MRKNKLSHLLTLCKVKLDIRIVDGRHFSHYSSYTLRVKIILSAKNILRNACRVI